MKKKVLVLSSLSDLQRGGQRSILFLLKNLDRNKCQPILVCQYEDEFIHEAKQHDIETKIIKLPSLRSLNVFKIFRTIFEIRNLLKKESIDIVHSEFSRGNVFYGLAKLGLPTKLIWHSRISMREPFWYEFFLYHLADKIIAVSKGAQKRFHSFKGYQQKVALIYNAVDPNLFDPSNRAESFRDKWKLKGITIGIIGQLYPLKGQNKFLEAASFVYQEYSNAHFVLVGDGDQENTDKLRKQIDALGLKECVTIIPFQDDISSVMASLDILVNGSQTEGFSRVIIEAMAAGHPIIATNVGGNPEAVLDQETGFLVEYGDVNAMAEKIKILLANENQRVSMGKKSRKRVEELFTVSQNARFIEEVYESII